MSLAQALPTTSNTHLEWIGVDDTRVPWRADEGLGGINWGVGATGQGRSGDAYARIACGIVFCAVVHHELAPDVRHFGGPHSACCAFGPARKHRHAVPVIVHPVAKVAG